MTDTTNPPAAGQLRELIEHYHATVVMRKLDFRLEQAEREYRKAEKAREQADSDQAKTQAIEAMQSADDTRTNLNTLRGSVAHWLTREIERVNGLIGVATHPTTFTSASIKCAVIDATRYPTPLVSSSALVGSHSAGDLERDTFCGAALQPIAQMLAQAVGGYTIADAVRDGRTDLWDGFAANDREAAHWTEKLQGALGGDLHLDGRLKQVYFPVAGGEGYHLLAPLFPSSLYDQIHQRLMNVRFGEANTEARQARRRGVGYAGIEHDVPNLVAMQPVMAQYQNVSTMNSSRQGIVRRLPCTPPRWDDAIRPPMEGDSAFWRLVERKGANRRIRYLKRYLKARHWQNNVSLRQHRDQVVRDIAETVIHVAAAIQNNTALAGWSADADLPRAEVLWLDPGRGELEPAFAAERAQGDYVEAVRQRFATWLNNRMRVGDAFFEVLDDDEKRHWAKQWEQVLDDIELDTEGATL